MERFFVPSNNKKFIRWLLQTAIDKSWTIVLEYSSNNTYDFLKSIATEIPLPVSSKYEYDLNCKLTAIINPCLTDKSIEQIIALTHVLSVHSEKEMIFLVADDFHKECFSCTVDFSDKYYNTLCDEGLVDIA